MSGGHAVAIAGATGAVGLEMLRVLEARSFPVRSLKLLASKRSAGRRMTFMGEELVVEELREDSFRGVDLALFSAGASISRDFRRAVVDAGALMVDNSSAFRAEPEVPLVVPEVNADDIAGHQGVIANPNCSTIIMLVAVAPLHRRWTLRRLVAATYQAASGAGAKAMEELAAQARQVLEGRPVEPSAFAHQIAFNLIPQIDAFLDNGYTKEELKMLNESRKILRHPGLRVSCTCVRVPVLRAHSEALNLEFEQPVSVAEARALLESAPGVLLVDDADAQSYPMPVDATGRDEILVGRIRQDISRDDARGLDLFVSGDQILKGAALNAVQIAEVALRSPKAPPGAAR